MCGAVTGAIMAINILHGRDKPDDSKEENYQLVQQFFSKFNDRYSTSNCYDLIACNLATPEGKTKFDQLKLHDKCTEITGDATQFALEVLNK